MPKLTPKQLLWCDEYLVDLNATGAAIRAGYSANSAKSIGHENLTKPNLMEYVQSKANARRESIELDAKYVLKRLVDIDQMNVVDILDAEANLLPIHDWPLVWQISLSSIDVQRLREWDKNAEDNKQTETTLAKIKWPDKVKNLELLGKHIDIQAFRDRTEITNPDGGPLALAAAIIEGNLTLDQATRNYKTSLKLVEN